MRAQTEPVLPKKVRRLLIAGLLVITALGIYGLTTANRGANESGAVDSVLLSVTPNDNDQFPQQGVVRVQLRSGWDGKLTIDQREIPKAQMGRQGDDIQPSYQVLSFQPGPGKVLEYFPAGQNCATATYWAIETGPAQSFTKSWCFNAF